MLASVDFSVRSRFAIFDNFTTEAVRITMLLNDFLCGQFSADFQNSLFSRTDRIFNVGNMLLKVLVVQQIIFGKILPRYQKRILCIIENIRGQVEANLFWTGSGKTWN